MSQEISEKILTRAEAAAKPMGISLLVRSIRKNAVGYAFVAPAVLIYSFFVVYPFINSIYYSLTSWNGAQPVKEYVGLANYAKLLTDSLMWESLQHNLVWVIL